MSPINTARNPTTTRRVPDQVDWTSLSANPFAIVILEEGKFYNIIHKNNDNEIYVGAQCNGRNQHTQSFTFTCNENLVEINNISEYNFNW
jgi:hypothetical protein